MSTARVVNLDDYEYEAPDGTFYFGPQAFVLNHLDSAQAAMEDSNADPSVHRAVDLLLKRHVEFARFI